MARETKRMALYEAIRKGQSNRPGAGRAVGLRSARLGASRLAGRKKGRGVPRSVNAPGSPEPQVRRGEGFLSRRLEFSMSYLTAGVVLLAFMVVVAGAVRLGQVHYDKGLPFLGSGAAEGVSENPDLDIRKTLFPKGVGEKTEEGDVEKDVTTVKGGGVEVEKVVVPKPAETTRVEKTPVKAQGNNIIVIQAYFQRRDLGPVQEYFAANGVETEILERRSYYFLVTTARYHGFGSGADGAPALKNIREIGAKYKAPSGYESFRPHLFQDAYGEKIK